MPSAPRFNQDSSKWGILERFSFGDSPALADCLGAPVLKGKKTATRSPVSEEDLTMLGKRMVMLDGSGTPTAVLETIELTQCRFCDVNQAFAFDEGEGDRTLAYWRSAHQQYFTRRGVVAPDMLLYCERFRLVTKLQRT